MGNNGTTWTCYYCNAGKRGRWAQVNYKRRWVCHNCEDKIPVVVRNPCWMHGLPMREYGGCTQCEVEGY